MSAILDVGVPDDTITLLDASHPNLGEIALHANSLYAGFGKDKQQYWSSYRPQSGIGGPMSNAQFDILITPTSGNGGINVIDQLFLQLTISSMSTTSSLFTLKPVFQWLQRIEISMDGGNILQNIYGDELFADHINNSTVSNLDDIKNQLNLDPRNYLAWFDKLGQGDSYSITSGVITGSNNQLGQSTFLSQPYFKSDGTINGSPLTGTGNLATYAPYAKGGQLSPGTPYNFYIPINNSIMQQAKILLSSLSANIRLRFYMNADPLLFDNGVGVGANVVSINQATLWATGSRLSAPSLAELNLKYQNPVVSSFNYYLEFSYNLNQVVPATGGFNEVVLTPITGLCSQLLFYLQDDRPNIAYPKIANVGGVQHISNNMMTLPMTNIQFVTQDGSIYGSGTEIPNDLLILMNTYKSFPKSVSSDDRLYFRRYYYFEFSKFPIETAETAVFAGFYNMTGRERIRFNAKESVYANGVQASQLELDGNGNDVDAVPTSGAGDYALYQNCSFHLVANIMGEAIQAGGLVSANLPRSLN